MKRIVKQFGPFVYYKDNYTRTFGIIIWIWTLSLTLGNTKELRESLDAMGGSKQDLKDYNTHNFFQELEEQVKKNNKE